MDEILSALTDLKLWIGILLTSVIPVVFNFLKKKVKSALRGVTLKETLKIKSIRRNQDEVTFQSIKAHSYFLLFMGACGVYLILFVMGPLRPLLTMPISILLLVISPIFIIEIIWLKQDSYAIKLIKSRGKLRVTNASSTTRKETRAS
ncbi:hypothetical protein A9Q80_05505 [Cycloclasticus sp. 46_83_sub15_T18]|mgnify:CR=1 FL=1|nr:hypothetical protein A9Q80_05505 [Cycloclasticus sp. 46_83_sub15_T18]